MWSTLGPELLMSRAGIMGAQTLLALCKMCLEHKLLETSKFKCLVTFVVLLIYSSIRSQFCLCLRVNSTLHKRMALL